jgi:hypothetical protein
MSSAFTLDNNIAIPTIAGRGRKRKYPLDAMEVGQSFLVVDNVSAVRASIANFKKTNEGLHKDFTVRRLTDGTVRCWRTF